MSDNDAVDLDKADLDMIFTIVDEIPEADIDDSPDDVEVVEEKPQLKTEPSDEPKMKMEKLDESVNNGDAGNLATKEEETVLEIEHPYLDLINSFEYQSHQYATTAPEPPKTLEDTPVHEVSNRPALIKLLQTLRNEKEIAVDLIMGTDPYDRNIEVLSLSTRDADYLIDVSKLKNEVLLLTEIFINPKIVKIFWIRTPTQLASLQQTLCLYVINLFDLREAAKAFSDGKSPSFGLLLKDLETPVSINKPPANLKKRPLSAEAQKFCRTKSHYILYYYFYFKNKLLEKDEELYKNVLQNCREISKKVHTENKVDELKHLEARMKQRHKAELDFLKKMFAWRRNTAKESNKNPSEIMDKPTLLNFAAHIPSDASYINFLSKCDYVRKDSNDIIQVAKRIKALYRPSYNKTKVKKNESHAARVAAQGKKRFASAPASVPQANKKKKIMSPRKFGPTVSPRGTPNLQNFVQQQIPQVVQAGSSSFSNSRNHGHVRGRPQFGSSRNFAQRSNYNDNGGHFRGNSGGRRERSPEFNRYHDRNFEPDYRNTRFSPPRSTKFQGRYDNSGRRSPDHYRRNSNFRRSRNDDYYEGIGDPSDFPSGYHGNPDPDYDYDSGNGGMMDFHRNSDLRGQNRGPINPWQN